MPYKLSKEKRNNVKQRILSGEDSSNIVAITGVSKSTVLHMKKQIDQNYTRQSAGRLTLLPSSTHFIVRLKLKTGILTSIGGSKAYLQQRGFLVSQHTGQISRIQMRQNEKNACFGL